MAGELGVAVSVGVLLVVESGEEVPVSPALGLEGGTMLSAAACSPASFDACSPASIETCFSASVEMAGNMSCVRGMPGHSAAGALAKPVAGVSAAASGADRCMCWCGARRSSGSAAGVSLSATSRREETLDKKDRHLAAVAVRVLDDSAGDVEEVLL